VIGDRATFGDHGTNTHEHITHYWGHEFGVMAKQWAVEGVWGGSWRFHVGGTLLGRTEVVAVPRTSIEVGFSGRRGYLRTEANGVETDNLLRLPQRPPPNALNGLIAGAMR
jgi:hypothetical protein